MKPALVSRAIIDTFDHVSMRSPDTFWRPAGGGQVVQDAGHSAVSATTWNQSGPTG